MLLCHIRPFHLPVSEARFLPPSKPPKISYSSHSETECKTSHSPGFAYDPLSPYDGAKPNTRTLESRPCQQLPADQTAVSRGLEQTPFPYSPATFTQLQKPPPP